jgi:hypothetical protein
VVIHLGSCSPMLATKCIILEVPSVQFHNSVYVISFALGSHSRELTQLPFMLDLFTMLSRYCGSSQVKRGWDLICNDNLTRELDVQQSQQFDLQDISNKYLVYAIPSMFKNLRQCNIPWMV